MPPPSPRTTTIHRNLMGRVRPRAETVSRILQNLRHNRAVAEEHTVHTVAVQRGGRVEGLRRRVYRLTVGRGKGALVCRSVDDSVTIGSHPGNGLTIADPTVSRFHACIELDANGFLLSDLDSTNGTYIAGMRVGSVYL